MNMAEASVLITSIVCMCIIVCKALDNYRVLKNRKDEQYTLREIYARVAVLERKAAKPPPATDE